MCKAVEALNIVLNLEAIQEVNLETLEIQDITLINTLAEVARGVGNWHIALVHVQSN